MMSEIFQWEQLDFNGFPVKYCPPNNSQSVEGGYMVYQAQPYGTTDWELSKDINQYNSYLEYEDQQEKQVEFFSEFNGLDDSSYDIGSSPLQFCQEIEKLESIQYQSPEHTESSNESTYGFPLVSLEILKSRGSRFTQFQAEKENVSSNDMAQAKVRGRKLSTDEILRLGGEKFIRSCSQRVDDLCLLSHQVSDPLSCLMYEETKDIELVQFLLISAEKVGQQQFDRASKLLNLCDELSSPKGNPVQRLVYYFSKALREKITAETERITSKVSVKKQSFDVKDAMMSPTPSVLSFHKHVPFSQVSQFTGVQAVVENVAEAKRVHIIELEIRSGMQCTILMQALATRCQSPLEHLKVTAIGTKSQQKIEETGKRLTSFAQSLNISFSFHLIMVADILDLNEDLFTLDAEESIAIISSYFFWTLLPWPSRLEYLMRVIRNINPCVMVISEVDSNQNSPVFVNRFIEALFLYGSLFDALEDCMHRENPNRYISESMYLNQCIRTIVATEGEERTIRHVNISVWRAFFARCGMVEKELSMSSLYQASLVLKNFACGSSCTLDRDGKGLIIGWKGAPVHSLTTWKFL